MKFFKYSTSLLKNNVVQIMLRKNFLSTYNEKPFHFHNGPKFTVNQRNLNSYKPNWKNPKTPDLIYVPHILRWLKTKFHFKYLQKTWDPEFSEGAFIYGSTRAVCRITEIINQNKPDDLKGLVTSSLRYKLLNDMTNKFTKLQKQIISLAPDDIKILVPLSVNLITEGVRKKCIVSLRILALKWFEDSGTLRLVLVALQTAFARDYSEGIEAEWTICSFDVLECAMLSESPTAH